MSEFISFLAPPGHKIDNYNRSLPYSQQPDSVPSIFCDAMSVRETVFVKEQHVPLENELDSDDPRCFHWVTYASVGAKASPVVTPQDKAGDKRKSSTASRVPVGVIRLVPPPHPPHAVPGTEHKIDNSEDAPRVPVLHDAHNAGPVSSHNPHNEPYIKLGRLAVLREYRKMRLGKLLVDTALEWASKHAEEIVPPVSAMDVEAARVDGKEGEVSARWKGLVLVHAQKYVERTWRHYGFERDEGMGEWDEEGITHVGMVSSCLGL